MRSTRFLVFSGFRGFCNDIKNLNFISSGLKGYFLKEFCWSIGTTSFSTDATNSASNVPNTTNACSSNCITNSITGNIDSSSSKKLDPDWITGFTDAEGSFTVPIVKKDNTNNIVKDWRVFPRFAISLHLRDIDLLYQIKDFFGVGSVMINRGKEEGGRADFAYYVVSNIEDLNNVIIPHFEKHSLLTAKRFNFEYFKRIVKLMYNKKHLSEQGLIEIFSIRLNMNNKTPIKSYDGPIISISKPDLPSISINNISPQWFVGFTDGEGCFLLNMAKSNRSKVGYYANVSFTISQHSKDLNLFELFNKFFGGGNLLKVKNKEEIQFRIQKFELIDSVLIPFFKKYPLQSSKILNYNDWLKCCDIIRRKQHLTEEGIEELINIKSNLNKSRVYP